MYKLMRISILLLLALIVTLTVDAGTVSKTYHFGQPVIQSKGSSQTISFPNTLLRGKPGEPVLPWQAVSILLPPGESAETMRIDFGGFTSINGEILLLPQQEFRPVSSDIDGRFLKNEKIYLSSAEYPSLRQAEVSTSWLNGYSFALSSFTPLVYYPSLRMAGYYSEVTVTVTTRPTQSSAKALKNLHSSPSVVNRVRQLAQNPEQLSDYPSVKSSASSYQVLIITSQALSGGFTTLTNMYDSLGLTWQIKTMEYITANFSGYDNAEKVRNCIRQEYQQNGIEFALLGGDVSVVPYRGFYCYVISGSGYEDYNIPSDLYYSGMDGDYDANGNHIYGEVADNADLLPDVSVGRMPFENAQEQTAMIHKTVWYRTHQKPNEQARPLLVGEFMDQSTMTWGQDYLELMVNDHNDNGYFTHGIPSSTNNIRRLYDTLISPGNIYSWTLGELFLRINQGPSFIHHAGHSNTIYMMKMFMSDITNSNFYAINGVTHNYTLMYTHGCDCGAFDNNDCIAERAVLIDNFLAAGIFNSRYGWFDQGTTEGPSAHLNREFVSALYNDTAANQVHEIGSAHMMSKIKTAPFVGLPGEFEPGAQRWCHFDCNLLGDPTLWVFTEDIPVGFTELHAGESLVASPNPCTNQVTLRSSTLTSAVKIALYNSMGQSVRNWDNVVLSDKQPLTIPLDGISPGIYFLEARGANFNEGIKIIVR
jgi:hypothetical protein